MSEDDPYNPHDPGGCNFVRCPNAGEVACPVCGWRYCREHWERPTAPLRSMRAIHARQHVKRERRAKER